MSTLNLTYMLSGGGNTTCDVLLRTLRKVNAIMTEKGQGLPRILYLQMDNCVGDNKNKTVLGMCYHLVNEGVFDKIKVSFLPVGHTHEDIDQMFSIISKHLKRVGALSPALFADAIRGAFRRVKDKPDLSFVKAKYDLKSWFENNATFDGLQGMTRARVFRFQRYARRQNQVVTEHQKAALRDSVDQRRQAAAEVERLRRIRAELEQVPVSAEAKRDDDEGVAIELDRTLLGQALVRAQAAFDQTERMFERNKRVFDAANAAAAAVGEPEEVDDGGREADDVVMHYKREMCSDN